MDKFLSAVFWGWHWLAWKRHLWCCKCCVSMQEKKSSLTNWTKVCEKFPWNNPFQNAQSREFWELKRWWPGFNITLFSDCLKNPALDFVHWLIFRTTKSSNLADNDLLCSMESYWSNLDIRLSENLANLGGKAALKMLVMEVQEWDWVNYLTWEDGLQLRVEYWKLSYTPSPLGWSKVEPSPLALKRKDWIFQVVDCNISLHLAEI